jgi:hypothetical protein
MKRIAPALIVVSLAPVAWTQQVAPSLYSTVRRASDVGIRLEGWGGGSIAESDEASLEGSHSIRISSKNLFNGGIIHLSKAVDFSKAFDDKANLLELKFLFADEAKHADAASTTPGTTQPNNPRPSTGNLTPLQRYQMMMGGGGGSTAAPGGPAPAPRQLNPADKPVINSLRMVFTTTDGLKSETYLPVSRSAKDANGWRSLAVPVSAINGFGRTNKVIKDVAISAEGTTTLFVGGIKTINDTTPITVDLPYKFDNLNLAQGDKVELEANGFAGATPLVYEWDFNDTGDFLVDAVGPTIQRVFSKPGSYKVTVRVRDFYDLKKPASKSFKVVVNP